MTAPHATSQFPSRRTANVFIALLLAVHAGLGIDAARRLSVTHDEYWHLPAGLLAWKTGRFDFDRLNPPLTRLWAASPLLFTSATADDDAVPSGLTELGDRFLHANRERYELYYALARSMNVLWSVLTGWLLAVWARSLFGERAACLSVALWCCCPTVLAHAALVTPDMGATCLFTATLYAAWRFAQQSGWRRAFVLGALLGLAQLTKFTCLLLFPLVVVVWILARRERSWTDPAELPDGRTESAKSGEMDVPVPPSKRRTAVVLGARGIVWPYVLAAAVCVSVMNAGYLFRSSFLPWGQYQFSSHALSRLTHPPGFLGVLRVPLPYDYVKGLDDQRRIMEQLHPVYLDGRWSETGFADYALRTLAYKLPHTTQGLLLLGLLFSLRLGGLPPLWRRQAILLIPAVALLVVAGSTRMQLGVRYLLPAFPLLFLFAGQSARWFDWKHFRLRTLLVGTAALLLPLSLRYHPHHIAYFNEASGGPIGGRRHLLDSNLDWGQDLRAKEFLDERGIDDVGLAYFGMLPPSALGIKYHVPAWPPRPGWYAVSVNFVEGRPHTIRNPDGTARSADFREFARFQFFKPAARIGYSIDVFHITAEDLRSVRAARRVWIEL